MTKRNQHTIDKITWLIAALVALTCCRPISTEPVPSIEAASTQCEIRAFVKQGTDIEIFSNRADHHSEILQWRDPGFIFHITEDLGDRFYFHGIEELAPSSTPMPKEGWIDKSAVTININMSEVSPSLTPPHPIHLRSGPHHRSDKVQTFFQENVDLELLACTSTWVKLLVTSDKEQHVGWLANNDHCGNPLTTCH